MKMAKALTGNVRAILHGVSHLSHSGMWLTAFLILLLLYFGIMLLPIFYENKAHMIKIKPALIYQTVEEL